MNLNGMQVVVLSQPGQQNEQLTQLRIKPRLTKQLIGLGVMHILNGVFSIIFQSISLESFLKNAAGYYIRESFTWVGHGFWCGLPFLVTGIIGITAGIRKSNCQVIAFNILSIICALLACILVIMGVLAAIIVKWSRENRYGFSQSNHFNTDFYNQSLLDQYTLLSVLASMLAATGVLEGIISIWSAIVCCLIGVCNCCLASTPQTQPLILSAEQQAALMMSNPMVIQQQSMGGFRPQHQMFQHNKQQPNVPQNAYKNLISGATVEGYYTDLNTGLRCNRPSSDVDVSGCITTSIYEELHEYEEVEPASKL